MTEGAVEACLPFPFRRSLTSEATFLPSFLCAHCAARVLPLSAFAYENEAGPSVLPLVKSLILLFDEVTPPLDRNLHVLFLLVVVTAPACSFKSPRPRFSLQDRRNLPKSPF